MHGSFNQGFGCGLGLPAVTFDEGILSLREYSPNYGTRNLYIYTHCLGVMYISSIWIVTGYQ